MYLIPYIRAGRAVSSCLLMPDNPIVAISISEIISVLGPLLNPKLFTKIIGVTMAIMYNPSFAKYYVDNYINVNNIYKQAEICSILLFIFSYYLIYFYN